MNTKEQDKVKDHGNKSDEERDKGLKPEEGQVHKLDAGVKSTAKEPEKVQDEADNRKKKLHAALDLYYNELFKPLPEQQVDSVLATVESNVNIQGKVLDKADNPKDKLHASLLATVESNVNVQGKVLDKADNPKDKLHTSLDLYYDELFMPVPRKEVASCDNNAGGKTKT